MIYFFSVRAIVPGWFRLCAHNVLSLDVEFHYDHEKDSRLRVSRGVGFLDVIEAIEDGLSEPQIQALDRRRPE